MTIKIVLSSPLRTLPQSLRDSSLPEGAFEKFAAIMFVLAVYFLWGVEDVAPYNDGGDFGSPHCVLFVPFVFRRATTGRPYKNNKTLSLPVGAIIDRPQRCSLYLSVSHK